MMTASVRAIAQRGLWWDTRLIDPDPARAQGIDQASDRALADADV